MKKIKVLIVVGTLDIGGAEKMVVGAAEFIDKNKFDPHVCTLFSGGPHNYEDALLHISGVTRHSFNFKGPFDIKSWFQTYKFLKKEQFDILFTNLFEANFIIRLLNLFTGNHIVFIWEHNIYAKKQWWKILADRWLAKKTTKIFSDVQAVFDFTSQQENIPMEKFAMMNYPIELPKKKNTVKKDKIIALKKELGLPADSFVVGTVSRFVEQKGIEYFIQSAAKILENNNIPNLYFLSVGYGKLEEKLENLVKELHLESRVFIRPARHIAEILPILDIFVVSSLWESKPITMLEAMAYGCPTVVTSAGGTAEIVEEGKNALMCAPKDVDGLASKIITLAKDEKLRSILKEQGKLTAGKYSGPEFIRKLEQYFIEAYDARHKN